MQPQPGRLLSDNESDLDTDMTKILGSHGIRLEKLTRVADAIAQGHCKLINRDVALRSIVSGIRSELGAQQAISRAR